MGETVHTIKPGSLVRSRDNDKIGCVLQIFLESNDVICIVSWGDGSETRVSDLDLELLDKF